MDYQDHPLSSVLPLMPQMELGELAADIQLNGLRAPITLLDGKILDGRNRYRACKMVNVEPRFRIYNGEGHPLDFIVSVNLKRRHLTASQKAMLVAKIAQMPRGNPELKTAKTPTKSKYAQSAHLGKTSAEVAKQMDVSQRTVVQAKQVLRDAPSKTIEAVERGQKSVATAVKEIKKAKETEPENADKTGYVIPESVLEDWQRAESQKELLRKVSDVRSALKAGLEDQDVIFAETSNSTVSDLTNAYTSLKCLIPYAVCPSCQGVQRKKCDLCKKRGFVSEFMWRNVVPAETKKMREKK